MPSTNLATVIEEITDARHLLNHPFYRSWEEGALTKSDLGSYAEQYRYFEEALAEVLATTASSLEDEKARQLTEANLADELSNPAPHVELFDGFGDAVGARKESRATGATCRLVDLYRQAAAESPAAALAVISAYETQAAEIASTKAESLRRYYGLTAAQTEFWDVHATMERDHASWTVDALESLGADTKDLETWASRSADAWWEFLDDRESARLAGSAC